MTIEEFNSLPFELKFEEVFSEGEYLDSRDYYNQILHLFMINTVLETLLIEVYFQPGDSQIVKIEAVDDEVLGLYGDDVVLGL